MTKKTRLMFVAALFVGLALTGSAFAQATPAPAAAPAAATPAPTPAPAAEPAPAPAPEAAPAPEPMPAAAPAPEAAPAPVAEEEEGSGVAGWFRVDLDNGGLQLWAGATHSLSDTVGLASDIYVFGTFGEFDLGPAFTLGPVILTPMLGYQFDFAAQVSAAFVPQLYTIVDSDSVYFESWIQVYMQSLFADTALDFLHTRNFILYKVSDQVAFGPEIDVNIALKNKPVKTNGDDATAYYLPIGAHLNLFYGEASTLQLFLGYDVVGEDLGHGKAAGRFTFVQTF